MDLQCATMEKHQYAMMVLIQKWEKKVNHSAQVKMMEHQNVKMDPNQKGEREDQR